jgi:hypothetical protein
VPPIAPRMERFVLSCWCGKKKEISRAMGTSGLFLSRASPDSARLQS